MDSKIGKATVMSWDLLLATGMRSGLKIGSGSEKVIGRSWVKATGMSWDLLLATGMRCGLKIGSGFEKVIARSSVKEIDLGWKKVKVLLNEMVFVLGNW